MSDSSDANSNTSSGSDSFQERREELENDPNYQAFCKNFEKLFGGKEIALGAGEPNLRLMGTDPEETNAARRLLQFSMYGSDAWHGLSVMRELEKPDSETPRLDPELKKRLKRTIKAFEKAYGNKKHSEMERTFKEENYWEDWTPILSSYELYKGYAFTNKDMGELVFAHKSKRKFILVNLCGARKSADGSQNYEEDYDSRLLAQAHRFLALVYYLPIGNVQWVRASYTTDEHPQLHPDLFNYGTSLQSSQDDAPPLLHLTAGMVKKCLTAKDLSVLDTFVSVCQFKPPGDRVKERLLLPEGAVDPTAIQLNWFDVNLGQSPLEKKCDGCDRFFAPTQLKACSACRSVLYCSQSCQKASWKLHKMSQCR